MTKAIVALSAAPASIGARGLVHAVDIVHDGEYFFRRAQDGEAWAAEDKIGFSLRIANPAGSREPAGLKYEWMKRKCDLLLFQMGVSK
jgi:hypothetical protein